ncbi:hypothetical protein JBL43_07500 [Aureibaculum sp. A20]|uniref:Lipoprotein n=1 Tax=Aureibaculum flavum TaxID=2795986 RepID=A0ABS0WQ21_9FLAO|nr:hypothetical protein [Aureibaculum flavum]MBJ2174076.1 hypothetical protein [Aureibaculum flavum]
MKTPITFLICSLILILFSNCATSQFDKNPSFIITEAKYQDWIGGKPGAKGTLVTIAFAEPVEDHIQFDSIFFNDTSAKLSIDSFNEKKMITGNFSTSNSFDKIIIMDKDPKKEFGNEVPKIKKKSTFQLSKNECVISYNIKNKKHYFKLNTLKKGKTIIYP